MVLPSELTRRALHAGLTPERRRAAGDADGAGQRPRGADPAAEQHLRPRRGGRATSPRAERSALRRALLDPADHRPWIDVAAAREGQGALAGALQALANAQRLDGGAALAARAARERVRLKLN